MPTEVRTIHEDEFENWVRAEAYAFGHHAPDEMVQVARSDAEMDRTFGAFENGEIVGTGATRTSAVTVPGGVGECGLVEDMAVVPTHRRRGIMTRMMRAQLDQMRERSEPLAALTASESLIYERFGYGIATWAHDWKIDRRHTTMKIPPSGGGHLRFIPSDSARVEWPRLHSNLQRERVGMLHYDAATWRAVLWDAAYQRGGTTEFFHVAYFRDNRMAGLCTYRMRGDIVLVKFLLGEDADVEAELWKYCFEIDLITGIHASNRSVGDPLPWRLEDPRRLERSLTDHMWLRLVNVGEALASRAYNEQGKLLMRVRDRFCPWNDGIYTLDGGPDGAECIRSQEQPQIELDVSDLAAVYLGGVSFSTLARAGRIVELAPGALALADRMFITQSQPWFLEL